MREKERKRKKGKTKKEYTERKLMILFFEIFYAGYLKKNSTRTNQLL